MIHTKRSLSILGSLVALAAMGYAQSPPADAAVTIGGKAIRIHYSAPSVRGRDMFGPKGIISGDTNYPIWRAGANNATELQTDADLTINGLNVPKGTYSLFIDLTGGKWQLIVNKQTGQSGLEYDKSKDLGRTAMTMSKPSAPVEKLKFTLTDAGGNKGKLDVAFENYEASVTFTVK